MLDDYKPLRGRAWSDGGGNVGLPCACACVLKIENGDDVEFAKKLPNCKTNNEAEYEGVLLAMEIALENEITDLVLFSDSKLIVNQIHGFYKANIPTLRNYLAKVNRLQREFDSFSIEWVRRTENMRADKLAKRILKPPSLKRK